ncbi:MAG: polysaccharide biosynthesis/export family protein [Bacteroidota bacterium]
MTKTVLYFSVLIILFFASCVPTKDLIYLQNKDNSEVTVPINPIVSKPYRVQSNDILSINIKAIDQKLVAIFNNSASEGVAGQSEQGAYFEGYSVDDHGNIRIPVLGELNVLGFTTDEIRKKIETLLLAEYFNQEANIFVIVKLAGFRYTINGEIGSPGSKVLYRDNVSVMEAIANSGDITITGDRKNIVVMRQFPQGTEMHSIDLTDINAMKSPYYYLQPNDFIYIKPLKQKSWGTGKTGIESLSTIITVLSLLTTSFLLLK